MTTLRAVVLTLVAVMSAALLGACGDDDDGTASSAQAETEAVRTNEVNLPKSYKFEPEVIAVEPGTTVTWTNEDDFPHNVHLLGDDDRTEDLPVGESASITFDEAGTYDYECSLHPSQMKGTVVVET